MNTIYSDEVFAYPGGVKFSDGLVINWGNTRVGTVTFPIPFTTTNYSVAYCQSDPSEHNVNNTLTNKTTTSFRFGMGYQANWIAIGY